MNITLKHLRLFIRLSRPVFLLGGVLLYGLGISIVSFLGDPIDIGLLVQGQVLVTSIQLMANYLNEYSDEPIDRENPNRTPFSGGSGALGGNGLPREVALYAAIVSMASAALISIMLLIGGQVSIVTWSLILLSVLGAFFYSVPPVRLMTTGYGELTTSIIVAGFLPAIAYSLQNGELHRLLIMSSTPLVALHFAMMLAFELPDYATDLQYDKRALMVRMGWETGMRLHDFAILFAMLSMSIGYLNGLPPRVAAGTLISLPLAIAQLWQMRRIRQGYPVRWPAFTLGALALFALTSYLEMIGYILS